MSKRAPLRLVEDERAEFSVSALMFLSVVLVSTSILSTFLLAITERTMVDGRESADQQADVINGIVSLRFLELSGYDAAIADDELHVGFEMPYLIGTVEDVDVRWVLLCSNGAAGTAETVAYSTGDFEGATSITGDGRTAADLDFFDSSGVYHLFMPIDGTGDCDLDANFDGQLIIVLERGRTFEFRVTLGSDPSVGDQLL